MESPLLSILLPAILSALFLILLIKRFTLHKTSNPTNLPPGPWKIPIIGNLHQLLGEHPHRRLQNLANTYGPLLHLKLGEINLIVITSRDFVRDIFTTHDVKFASRPKLMAGKIIFYNHTNVGFAPYSKTWSKLRKICTLELLSLKRVMSLKFIREEEGNNLVEKIRTAGRSPVNLSVMLLSLSNVTIVRAAIGKGSAQQQRFLLAMKKTFKYLSGFSMVDLFPSWSFLGEISGLRHEMERLHMEMDVVLNEIIEEHEGKKLDGDDTNEDLVDVLLRIKRSGEMNLSLTMENIKGVLLDLFVAGTETSSTTLVWAMTELIRHPKVMQKAQYEVRKALNGKMRIEEGDIHKLHYINQVIKETLRLHPPTPLMVPRLCCETVELAGYTVPVESWVMINIWAMMRDPKYWEDPEIFQPERFEEKAIDFGVANFEFIPFGGGRRICPGMSFALASMELWLAQLLFYFDWELPGGRSSQELDVEEDFAQILTRKTDLYLCHGITTCLRALLILLIKKLTLHQTSNRTNFPPGPWKLPIIVNLHQLLGKHPHRRLRNLAKTYGPLFHLKLDEINLIVITSSEFVRDIFKTHDLKFASRPKLMASKIILYNYADLGLALYGNTWSKLRKICIVELLNLKRVTSFKFIREEEGNNLVEKIRMAGRSPVNLSAKLLSLSNVTIARFLLAMKKTFEYLSRFNVVDLFPSWSFLGEISGLRHGMERVHMEMDDVLNEIIEEHEGKKLDGDDTNEDFVDVLLRIKRSGELDLSLTMENVKAIILDLFLAGFDPSSTIPVWAITELIRHPMVMQKAQLEERKALKGKNVSAPVIKTPSFPVSFHSPGQKLSFNSGDLVEGIDDSSIPGGRLLPPEVHLSEDLESILSGGPWFILGKPFILQRWSPKFKPKRDEAAPIPIWIKIVDFPLALWTPTDVSRISSFIGIPISVDSLTASRSRLTFAKVCVLISKDSALPDEIPLEIDGEDMVLKVLYDWKPDRCEGCGYLIHPFSLCPKNPNLQLVLPPKPTKTRGRSSSRARTSRPHRLKSKAPSPNSTHNVPQPNPPLLSSHPRTSSPDKLVPPKSTPINSPSKTTPIPNLNIPTEEISSSEILIIPRPSQGPNITLLNKFFHFANR
ncbi:hypothetical protein KFK09_008898 [Dendrobium nobile]|uniref:DUF4283 domain-containing protein n=1 Tax=Dendrobium nobile TaxID=94219 RepID=A0A8T3BQW1_DENNO|nr:hypothetical protein KFK09_008898 [Dendrobium nobile]